ncbi:14960_t:CDS:1, partial [Rhizophagus irregularis]
NPLPSSFEDYYSNPLPSSSEDYGNPLPEDNPVSSDEDSDNNQN